MNNSFEYSGHDNLEIMSLAKKYNQTIFDWLSQGQSSSHRVLDFGSGHGEFFFRFVEQDYPTTAVELDESVHSIYPDGQVFADLAMAEGPFELVYSVNVLEHIEHRAEFLGRLVRQITWKNKEDRRLLIRVPMIDREWITIYKKELGIEYRLDSTHFTEYTFEQFEDELNKGGVEVLSHHIRFGEIYAVCRAN